MELLSILLGCPLFGWICYLIPLCSRSISKPDSKPAVWQLIVGSILIILSFAFLCFSVFWLHMFDTTKIIYDITVSVVIYGWGMYCLEKRFPLVSTAGSRVLTVILYLISTVILLVAYIVYPHPASVICNALLLFIMLGLNKIRRNNNPDREVSKSTSPNIFLIIYIIILFVYLILLLTGDK